MQTLLWQYGLTTAITDTLHFSVEGSLDDSGILILICTADHHQSVALVISNEDCVFVLKNKKRKEKS